MSLSDLHTGILSLPLIYLRMIEIGIAAFSFLMQLFNSAIVHRFCNKNFTLQQYQKSQECESEDHTDHATSPTREGYERRSSKAFIDKYPKLYFLIILYDKETRVLKWHNIIIVSNATTVTSVNKSTI